MAKLLCTDVPGTPKWLEHHRGKIGGHAAVNILFGNDPRVRTFGSPLSEWARLTNKVTPEGPSNDDSMTEILRWGNDSEPLHRTILARETGCEIQPPMGTIQHDEIPYLIGTVDGTAIIPEEKGTKIDARLETLRGRKPTVELKAPTRFTFDEWKTDDHGLAVPYHARAQGAYYAILRGDEHAIVSGLLPPRVVWQAFAITPELRDSIIGQLVAFWENHVQKDIPPEPGPNKADMRTIKALHPKDNGGVILLPEDLDAQLDAWEAAESRISADAELIAVAKAKFALAIGDNTWGEGRGYAISHRWQSRAAHVVKESEFRVLRRAAEVSFLKSK